MDWTDTPEEVRRSSPWSVHGSEMATKEVVWTVVKDFHNYSILFNFTIGGLFLFRRYRRKLNYIVGARELQKLKIDNSQPLTPFLGTGALMIWG